MQDRTPDSLRRFLCVMHSVRTHSGRAGVSLRFRAAKTTTGEDLMLLSGSLHHPQTHRDTLNQHNLLLLLFFFHLTGPKRRSQSLSLSLSLLTSSLFHTHRKEKHSHTVRWPGRGSTSLNKTGLIIPSSLFLLLLLLFLPPPLQLFTEVAPTASQISIYITSALSLLGQLHSRNAGPTGSSAPCVVEGRASAM